MTAPRGDRIHVDTTGSRSRVTRAKSLEQRLTMYGAARVMMLFELMRELESLHAGAKVTAVPAGAVWQAYKGSHCDQACHTVPSHLQLDGMLPTLKTRNVGLRRHIIVEFADCFLMPSGVNQIDLVFDESGGRQGFAAAAPMRGSSCAST